MKNITNNEKETFEFGEEFANKLNGGDLILLTGDLGAGKTVFTKGISKHFKLNPNNVNSPTFVVLKEYETKESKSISKIIHIDAYRLLKIDELYNIGLKDYLKRKDSIIIIEWADKFKELKNTPRAIIVDIKYLDEEKREISCSR